MKGISKKASIALGNDEFMNPNLYASSVKMRPTTNYHIVMQMDSRKILTMVNLKRRLDIVSNLYIQLCNNFNFIKEIY